jgi:hypothetical protein
VLLFTADGLPSTTTVMVAFACKVFSIIYSFT